MKLNINKEEHNPHMKRDELEITVEHDGSATPSRAALQALVSKQLKKDIETVDVRNIFSDKGVSSSRSFVFVWEEKKVADLSKAKTESKEAAPEEKAPEAAEAPKEEKAPEKPAEDKKKEVPPKEENK